MDRAKRYQIRYGEPLHSEARRQPHDTCKRIIQTLNPGANNHFIGLGVKNYTEEILEGLGHEHNHDDPEYVRLSKALHPVDHK